MTKTRVVDYITDHENMQMTAACQYVSMRSMSIFFKDNGSQHLFHHRHLPQWQVMPEQQVSAKQFTNCRQKIITWYIAVIRIFPWSVL